MHKSLQSIVAAAGLALAIASGAGSTQASVNLIGDTATLEWGAITQPVSSWSLAAFGLDHTGPSNNADLFGPTLIGSASPTFQAVAPDYIGVDVNVGASSVTIYEDSSASSTSFTANSSSLPFNGFVLLDQTQALGSATLGSSTVAGLTQSDVRVIGGDLWVNLGGLSLGNGDQITIALGPAGAPVPEPTDWALLTLGVGAVGMILRRQRVPVAA